MAAMGGGGSLKLFGGKAAPVVAPADLPARREYLIFAVMALGQVMALTTSRWSPLR